MRAPLILFGMHVHISTTYAFSPHFYNHSHFFVVCFFFPYASSCCGFSWLTLLSQPTHFKWSQCLDIYSSIWYSYMHTYYTRTHAITLRNSHRVVLLVQRVRRIIKLNNYLFSLFLSPFFFLFHSNLAGHLATDLAAIHSQLEVGRILQARGQSHLAPAPTVSLNVK